MHAVIREQSQPTQIKKVGKDRVIHNSDARDRNDDCFEDLM